MSVPRAATSRLNLALLLLAVLAGGLLLVLALWPRDGAGSADGRKVANAEVAKAGAEPVGSPVGIAVEPADPHGRVTIPEDHSMTLDVPALARADRVPVETGPGSATAPLRHGALHVEGTGFPWQRGANVYLAAHRLGFPGTKSHLLFWDLPTLQEGDKVLLTDSEGTRYEYRVFRKMGVGPRDVHVAEPVPGKSVVSLQTCTLPDYSGRVVVQAELVAVRPGAASTAE